MTGPSHRRHSGDHLLPLTTGFFAERSLAELAEGLRRGEWSSKQLVDYTLDAVTDLNPVLNAFVAVDDRARAAAARADAELAQGTDRGLLHGLPVGIKDIIDVAGLPTSAGSAIYRTRIATTNAACVDRLIEAGAVVVGKTVLDEFAYGATGDRSAHGPSRNPHDSNRMSGGSSGGSAVAVAAGMVPTALGTDTAGSVRVPASLCGIGGFKPAFDAIATTGVHPLARSLDHVGVLTWFADDAIRIGSLLSGHPNMDRLDRPHESPIRIGWIDPTALGAVDQAVLEASRRSVESAASGVVIEIDCPPAFSDALFGHFSTIQASEAYLNHRSDVADRSADIDPEVLARLQWGQRRHAWQYLQSTAERQQLGHQIDSLWSDFDVLAMPTTPFTAPHVDQRSVDVNGIPVEVRASLLSFTSPWNLTGNPAVSVPIPTAGMPIGVQLITARSSVSLLSILAREIGMPTVQKG